MKKLALAVSILVLTCGCGSNAPPTLVVVGINPVNPINIDQGQTQVFTASAANDPTNKGVLWTASGPGCSGSACGTFTNVTSTSATYVAPASVSAILAITVTATSVAQSTQFAASAVFYVMPPLTITSTNLPIATPNVIYTSNLVAAGGVQPLKWTLLSGTLPAGMSLNNAGTIFGTPTTGGTSNFTVKVTDSSTAPGGGLSTQQSFSLTVVGLLTVPSASLPNGRVGTPYSASLPVSGGTPPLAWSLYSGSLPSGLVMQQTTGAITGTPTIQGSASFTVRVFDSSPSQQYYISPTFTITIDPSGPLTIQTTSLLDGMASTPYLGRLAAIGGTAPYNWTITSGSLPPGLTLGAATGAITGTPTSSTGTYSFTVQATDISSPQETASQNLSITLNAVPAACSSSGNNSVLAGQYAFSLRGYTGAGFLAVVGSFTADGAGNITAGEADTNGVLGAQNGGLNVNASSYSVGPDNRGCATLATPFGTFSTRFALGVVSAGVATQGRIIEFDTPSTSAYVAAGQIFQQNATSFTSPLTGSYGLRSAGWDPATSSRIACIGVVTGNNYKFGFLEQDCNDNGVVSNSTNTLSPTNSLVNTYSTADLNGRGTGIVLVSGSIVDLTFYWVSSTQLLIINSDSGPIFSGDWLLQSAPLGATAFDHTAFNGKVVSYSSGIGLAGAGGDVSLGFETADGISSVTNVFYRDVAGAWQTPNPTMTCSFSVVSIGRLTLGSACGATPPISYLYGQNSARVLGTDPAIELGNFEPQTAGLSNSSLAGTYFVGTSEVVGQGAQAEVGIVTLTSTGNLTGTLDTASTLSQAAGNTGLDLYTLNADGSLSLASSGATVVGMAISGSKFVLVSNPTLTFPTLLVGQR